MQPLNQSESEKQFETGNNPRLRRRAPTRWQRARLAIRIVPDAIIATGVIGGILALGTGFRVFGGTAMLIAILVGWKRQWCIGGLQNAIDAADVTADDYGAHVDVTDIDTNAPDASE